MRTIRPILTGFAVTAAGLAVVGGLTVASASAASAATKATATTSFTDHADSGNHGDWAYDTFTRTATVTLLGAAGSLSDCGSGATSCYQFAGTISDAGSFAVISGASSPQAGVTETGTPSGPFQGNATVSFYSSSDDASASGVPSKVTGAGPVSTTDWVELFFASGTTFGSGPTLPGWSWAYASPSTCENWVDASTNSDGSLSADGDITGVNECFTATGAVSSFSDYSASCLDNTNYTWADGNPLQLWSCGAAGGADQNFRLNKFNGTEVLEAVAAGNVSDYPWCVTAPGAIGRLTISVCTGANDQTVVKRGPYYVFPFDGYVMDDSGFDTNNGAAVIAYPENGGRNQRWSLP